MTIAAANLSELEALEEFARAFEATELARPREAPRLSLDAADVKSELARLVFTAVESLQETLERQALRCAAAGSLTQEQVERLGEAFLQLSQQMQRLKQAFERDREDLHPQAGPSSNVN